VRERLSVFLAMPHEFELTMFSVRAIFSRVSGDLLVLMLAPVSILAFAAVAASLAQHPWIWAISKLKPSFSAFNPIKGLASKFSLSATVEFAKDLIKFVFIGTAVATVIWPERILLISLNTIPAEEILPLVKILVLKICVAVIIVMAVLSLADFAYQRFDHHKKNRMTKNEVKDERKQSDGDPKIKQRLATIRMTRMRQRMMAAVPEADVVITNPTHYAVALQYMPEVMTAPKVLAKGLDLVALRIRGIAEDNGIPVVENPPLARALHDTAEINQEIPLEHFKAVAEVIGYIMRKRGDLPQQAGVSSEDSPPVQ
jgi:flagellar biosynthetic protein FlhB